MFLHGFTQIIWHLRGEFNPFWIRTRGLQKKRISALYEYATKEKFSPLVIDMEESNDKSFRKVLLKILDLHVEWFFGIFRVSVSYASKIDL